MTEIAKNSSSPIVSVVMSIRDSAATVVPAVRSLLMQSLSDWELILIDDGSRDDGAARVAAFGDSRIRIVTHKEAEGLPRRLNEGIDLARGAYIARMDADDVCYPERLETQIGLLRSDSSLDLVASKALVFNHEGKPVGIFPVEVEHARITANPKSGFYFPHPTWCGKATWFRANRYNERMLRAQDQELLLRTVSTSRFGAADRILLGYRQEPLQLMKSARGRVLFSGALWRQGRMRGQRLRSAIAILEQMTKLAAETIALGLGVHTMLVGQKFIRPSQDELTRWNSVWRAVHGERQIAHSGAEKALQADVF